jgi:hypothetical protein
MEADRERPPSGYKTGANSWGTLLRTRAPVDPCPSPRRPRRICAQGIQKLALPDILGAGRFWSLLHEARADFDVLLGSLYLLIEGPGAWSLNAILARNSGPHYLRSD